MHGEDWKLRASAAMDRYASGDAAAFSELYDLLAPRLYAFFLRRTRHPTSAEELLQETFFRMHRGRCNFASGADVAPWAFAISHRLLVDRLRSSRCDPTHAAADVEGLDEDLQPAASSPEEALARRRLAKLIEAELERMPEAHRMAFELVQRDGLSMNEAAQALGTTIAAVKLRAHRAYQTLRATLGSSVREELGWLR